MNSPQQPTAAVLVPDAAPLVLTDADFATSNPVLAETIDTARQVARTDAAVLITGERGSGKSVLARAIHGWSRRAAGPYETINCRVLSAELLAVEWFGHPSGAVADASSERCGRVQMANGGTLFVDGVGELPESLQRQLLRLIQERSFERVGDSRPQTSDVRIVAATARDLAGATSAGRFREDLFYRLNVIHLTLPPLRERREDILPLAERLLARHVRRYARPARGFDSRAATMLVEYRWPGNLRELSNVIERAAMLCAGEAVLPEHLPFTSAVPDAASGLRAGDPVTLAELERAHIQAVMAATPTLESAARALGIDTSTLYRKRRQYGTLGSRSASSEASVTDDAMK